MPVDLNEYPDYLAKVSTPMDLSTIREQLVSGNYDEPKDLNKDLKLIFQNSKLYNTDKRSAIYAMTLRLQSLAAEKIKSILNNYKQEQARLESKKGRSNRLTNGKGRKNKLEHNSSTEPQPSTSRSRSEQATSSHYTNGHDRPSTSRGQSSRHEVQSNDEDYQPSGNWRYEKMDGRQMQASSSGRPRRQMKAVQSYPDNDETDLEEEESDGQFDVTLDEETDLERTEDDEQTEEQTEEDDSPRRSSRLTNGNRKSIKRKKGGRRTRKTNKKMKLVNGSGSYKGE